jgi:hypothetical protein
MKKVFDGYAGRIGPLPDLPRDKRTRFVAVYDQQLFSFLGKKRCELVRRLRRGRHQLHQRGPYENAETGNPYDGHAPGAVIEATQRLSGRERALVVTTEALTRNS